MRDELIAATRETAPNCSILRRSTSPSGRGRRRSGAVWAGFRRRHGVSKAKGIWRDDDKNGALVKDEPVVVHCDSERRFVPLAPRTLKRLEAISAMVREHDGMNVEAMQLAALPFI
jgi:hypothetical protein